MKRVKGLIPMVALMTLISAPSWAESPDWGGDEAAPSPAVAPG